MMTFLVKLLAFFFIETTVVFAQGQENAFNSVCNHGLVDAATVTKDGSTYLFQGDYYWKYISGGVAYGYPKLISKTWKGVQKGHIDAALTWDDGSTFIFQGKHYWRYVNKRPLPGYPKIIQDGFGDIPSHMDAAVEWDDGFTYFFKGDQYWRFMPNVIDPLMGNYPKSIANNWQGVPNNVTAAVVWEGITYFFKQSNYYRYDSVSLVVLNGYPKSTAKEWYQCAEIDSRLKYTFEKKMPNPEKKTVSQVYQKSVEILKLLKKVNKEDGDISTGVETLEEYALYNTIEEVEDELVVASLSSSTTASTVLLGQEVLV